MRCVNENFRFVVRVRPTKCISHIGCKVSVKKSRFIVLSLFIKNNERGNSSCGWHDEHCRCSLWSIRVSVFSPNTTALSVLVLDGIPNPHYCKKNDAWRKITLSLERDVKECKNKMLSLLASHRKEKGKVKKSHISRTGKFYSLLNFILHFTIYIVLPFYSNYQVDWI